MQVLLDRLAAQELMLLQRIALCQHAVRAAGPSSEAPVCSAGAHWSAGAQHLVRGEQLAVRKRRIGVCHTTA